MCPLGWGGACNRVQWVTMTTDNHMGVVYSGTRELKVIP